MTKKRRGLGYLLWNRYEHARPVVGNETRFKVAVTSGVTCDKKQESQYVCAGLKDHGSANARMYGLLVHKQSPPFIFIRAGRFCDSFIHARVPRVSVCARISASASQCACAHGRLKASESLPLRQQEAYQRQAPTALA